MAKAEIDPGICGYHATVETRMSSDGELVDISIQSNCPAIQKLAHDLIQVNPFKEISSRRAVPESLQAGLKYCTHAACLVPVGIIKAIEVEAGLALPRNASIKVSKE